MLSSQGETLTSDNQRSVRGNAFVMHGGETIEASSLLSPADIDHFTSVTSPPKRTNPKPMNMTDFVLVGQGLIEASAEQLSPSDRKLYYRRQSFSSPKVLPSDPLPLESEESLTDAWLS